MTNHDRTPASSSASSDAVSQASARRLATQTLVATLLLVAAVAAGALWFREPLQALGNWFVARLGLAGVFIGVLAADALTFPVPPDGYLVASVMGGAKPVPLLIVASVASVLGGNVAYYLGHRLERWPWMSRRLESFRPKGQELFRKWGMAAVVIAAWTPVPFSLTCMLAGAFGMARRRFFLATLHRVPRLVVYYLAIVLGWSVG